MKLQTLVPTPPQDGSGVPALSVPSAAKRKRRILVADDDEGIRFLLSVALTLAGYDVNLASDGEQAWDTLSHDPHDLLITDNEMPRLTGLKLIERIRKTGMRLPVIVVSGSVPAASARESPQLQIAVVLSKPFTIPELMKAVGSALWNEGERVASFGAADLIHQEDGREVRGGVPAAHAAAREWSSLFPHEAPRPSAPLPGDAPRPNASKGTHNRILIADDDALVRGSLAAVLEYEDFVVDEAQNGIEAVTRAIEHTPDLVLLDLNMPHWDGWTAFSKLDQVSPLLPVIVITARPNEYRKAVQLGVDAFMEKPLNIPVLVRAIRRLTSEEENRHLRRITSRAFVTQLLANTES